MGEVVEAHGGIGKEAAFGGPLHQDKEAGVAGVVLDGVRELGDDFLFPFEGLHEVAVLVEKHAGDAEGVVFGAGGFEHVFDFVDGETFRGRTDIDDAKHGSLRTEMSIQMKWPVGCDL